MFSSASSCIFTILYENSKEVTSNTSPQHPHPPVADPGISKPGWGGGAVLGFEKSLHTYPKLL